MADIQARTARLDRIEEGSGSSGRFALVAAVIGSLAGIVALKWLDLGSLAFAIASLVLVAGFAIAVVAWLTKAPTEGRRVNSWDIAGALVFIGFGAAIIGT